MRKVVVVEWMALVSRRRAGTGGCLGFDSVLSLRYVP